MRENISRFKGIMSIAIVCIILYFTIYPLYIRWIAGNYADKFSQVLNSHDMERYDRFFSKDTIFEFESSGRQIKYIDAKENMEKMQAFTSRGSYGRLEEWYDYKELIMITCLRRTYTVDFFLLRVKLIYFVLVKLIYKVSILFAGTTLLTTKWL